MPESGYHSRWSGRGLIAMNGDVKAKDAGSSFNKFIIK